MIELSPLKAVSPVVSIILAVAATVVIVSVGAAVLMDISDGGETSFSTAAVEVTENKNGSKTVRVLRMADAKSVTVGGTQLDTVGETYTVTRSTAVVRTQTKDGSRAVLRTVRTSASKP